MPEGSSAPTKTEGKFSDSLERLARKVQESKTMRRGDIIFRLTGPGAGNYALQCAPGDVRVVESPAAGSERVPLIEVMGDSEAVRAVMSGEADPVKQFLTGGLRVRGDLRYLSDLALELGVLKTPL